MTLPKIIHFNSSFFRVIRRDSATCTMYLRSDAKAMAIAEKALENNHGNPFLSHRDKTRYINEGNKDIIQSIQSRLPSPLSPAEIRELYVLVENYETTCG